MVTQKKKRGKRSNAEKKSTAEYLFLTTNLSQKEIAQIAQVTEKTLSGWVNANNGAWKIAKSARTITKEKIISDWYLQLHHLNKTISDRPEGERFPTAAEADTMAKISSNIDKLEKKYNFGTYVTIVEEFVAWLMKVDQESAAKISLQTIDFLKTKTKSLKHA